MTVFNSETRINKLALALGAEAIGVDLKSISEPDFVNLRDALHENGVLVVRDQDLNPKEQTEFTRKFGEIQYHINDEYKMPGQPEVLILSTELDEHGNNVGIPDAGSDWHSDHSYVDVPTAYTLLQSVIVPQVGGDTEWIGMTAAYEALSDDMKVRIQGLIGIHSFNRFRNPRMTRPDRHGDGEDYYSKRSPPDAFHPIVRTHPHTGRKALFISPRFTLGIKNMEDGEAQRLLDELFDHLINTRFIYHHKWRKGDLVIWDNRQTLHLALGGVKWPEVRRMHRSTVLGEVPA
jgi:taurine dioxygenase